MLNIQKYMFEHETSEFEQKENFIKKLNSVYLY